MLNLDRNFPKISCLMVTAQGRFEYFKRSIQTYYDQTYPNKELVIVNEGPKEYQQQIANYVINRQDVRLIFLDGDYTLGALRNISISLSFGEIFVQWDDDDFNAPDRLMIQYNCLIRSSAKICFLSDQLHYLFPTQQLFWENWALIGSGNKLKYSIIPGTIMAWRKEFLGNYYPSTGAWCRAGEDSVLISELCKQENNIALLKNFGYLQVYSYHGSNVWNLEHHLILCQRRSMMTQYMIEQRHYICRTIDYLKLPGPVKVMGSDGLAFIHET